MSKTKTTYEQCIISRDSENGDLVEFVCRSQKII